MCLLCSLTSVPNGNSWVPHLGARLRGRTATQRFKKGSEMVLERVLGKGSQKGPVVGFTVEKGSEKGSQKRFWEGGFPEGA